MGSTKMYSTLFLDRDGVVNRQLPDDYVKSIDEFIFLDGAEEAFAILTKIFRRIVMVTNQRGIGRGFMNEKELDEVHAFMLKQIRLHGGRIDKIYFCTAVDDDDPNRKPNPGMAMQAQHDFPDIDFANSMVVGDSLSDMEFASHAGIPAVLIGNKYTYEETAHLVIVARFPDLLTFAKHIQSKPAI
ncbi:MAG: HAD family hydrolase [Prolixibacteraceae bacterium]|nr:HAD family hydrolase [Prolixibacteraceae bacterium]